ncbi:DUF4123 domain-containing protein [Rhodovulum sp. MB263]|uniref:DUF4123 domain-containing protein n=1 Tax=Rhodovulum sp. (strain MB263) TaxID=308754 RepID=UPI0009B7A5AB|nr:DUF4123 domain-containing protein [Rhodovulum sp. MB263]ARC89454.1 hypothetical protein B5V46_12995 [Rhodovulum sp. MB263]
MTADFWMDLSGGKPGGQMSSDGLSALHIETLTNFRPLDSQFGKWPTRTVPEDLMPHLFPAGDDGDSVLALIDAARMPMLPEVLEASGLDHRCLFKGDARDEWGDAAPWLVRLEQESDLTRKLFTGGKSAGQYWNNAAAIFIRSSRSLDMIWSHLRKFTKFQDAGGRWIFFRFWAPPYLARYLKGHDEAATPFLEHFLLDMTFILPEPVRGMVSIAHVSHPDLRRDIRTGNSPGRWPGFRRDIARIRLDLFVEKLDRKLTKVIPSTTSVSEDRRLTSLHRMARSAISLGLREERAVERYCLSRLMLGFPPEQDRRFDGILQGSAHDLDRSRDMLALAISIGKEA